MSSAPRRALAATHNAPTIILNRLTSGPATMVQLSLLLGLSASRVSRIVRSLRESGDVFVRGELVVRAAYYQRESDGFTLAILHCAGRFPAGKVAGQGDAA